jgi:hypothetical protein
LLDPEQLFAFLVLRVYITAMNPVRCTAVLFLCLSAIVWLLASSKSTPKVPPPIADGEYMGLEPMPSVNPEIPDEIWYHENTIVVRAGELILDENPVGIREGKKSYSASDGGFITYRGRFLTKKGKHYVSLRPFASDYIAFPIGPTSCEAYSRVDIYPVKITKNGFWISGVLYTPNTLAADQLKALENELKSEPFEYDGKHPYWNKRRLPKCQPNDLSVLDD